MTDEVPFETRYDPATGVILPKGGPKIEHSAELDKLATALSKAQLKVKDAQKDATNPHFKAGYATISSVLEACRLPLAEQGIAIIQAPFNDGVDIGVSTMLIHTSGQWIRCSLQIKPGRYDAQAAGGLISYIRRYSLLAMAAIAPADDDDAETDHRAQIPSRYSEQKAQVIQYQPETVKPKGEKEQAREDFVGLKKAILAAPHKIALDSLRQEDKLARIKAQSPDAHDQLMALFASKEGLFKEKENGSSE